jgi:hypothetical protein
LLISTPVDLGEIFVKLFSVRGVILELVFNLFGFFFVRIHEEVLLFIVLMPE